MVFRTVGAIATALIGVRVKLWRNTIRLIRPIRASRFPLRLTLTSCRRSTRLRCRTTHCRRSEWDPHISRCPGAPYEQGIAAPPADALPLPPVGSPGYQPRDCGPAAANPYGLRRAIPPGPPGSARQDAIREEAIRSQLRNSPVKSVRHQQEPDRCKAATRLTGLRCRPRCGPRAGRGRNWHPGSHAHKLSHQGTGGRGLLSIRRTPTFISCSATVKHCAMG
jgi:hypothetical protein